MTTQNVRKKILHALHFKLKLLIKCYTSYIKKVSDGNLLFWLSVLIAASKSNCIKKIVTVFKAHYKEKKEIILILSCDSRSPVSQILYMCWSPDKD